MNLFQLLSVWCLRALALWGAVELSASVYDRALAQTALWSRLSGHGEAMERLELRAATAEGHARDQRALLAEAQSTAWAISAPEAIELSAEAARQVREDLNTFGAQTPVVDGESEAVGDELQRLTLSAEWREAADTAPNALHALARARPTLDVLAISIERQDRNVHVRAQFQTLARAERQSEPPS